MRSRTPARADPVVPEPRRAHPAGADLLDALLRESRGDAVGSRADTHALPLPNISATPITAMPTITVTARTSTMLSPAAPRSVERSADRRIHGA